MVLVKYDVFNFSERVLCAGTAHKNCKTKKSHVNTPIPVLRVLTKQWQHNFSFSHFVVVLQKGFIIKKNMKIKVYVDFYFKYYLGKKDVDYISVSQQKDRRSGK